MAQTAYKGTVYLRILFCFLLFVAPFVEFLIPGGDVYLAGAAGIVALAGIAFGRTRRQRTLFLSRVDVLFVICWIYVAFNMPLPLDGGMGIELIAMGAIWGYARLHDTPQFRRAVGRWMIMVGLGQAAVVAFWTASIRSLLSPVLSGIPALGEAIWLWWRPFYCLMRCRRV